MSAMTQNDLQALVDYHYWARDRLLAAVEPLSPEQFTRDLGSSVAPPRALVRFAPDARIADITVLLGKYQASIVGSAEGGMFRLQFKAMGRDEAASLLKKLEGEKIVSLAVAAQ